MEGWDGVFSGEGFDLGSGHVARRGLPFLADGRKSLVGLVDLLDDRRRKATSFSSSVGHIDIRATGVRRASSHRSLDIGESSATTGSVRDLSRQMKGHTLGQHHVP